MRFPRSTDVPLRQRFGSKTFGGRLRYIREQHMSFTRTDVMLAQQDVVN